ncbi:MAG: hypothetical protein V4695_01350 [Pseudomonadota bacterium]
MQAFIRNTFKRACCFHSNNEENSPAKANVSATGSPPIPSPLSQVLPRVASSGASTYPSRTSISPDFHGLFQAPDATAVPQQPFKHDPVFKFGTETEISAQLFQNLDDKYLYRIIPAVASDLSGRRVSTQGIKTSLTLLLLDQPDLLPAPVHGIVILTIVEALTRGRSPIGNVYR